MVSLLCLWIVHNYKGSHLLCVKGTLPKWYLPMDRLVVKSVAWYNIIIVIVATAEVLYE